MPARLTLHVPQGATRSHVIGDGESVVIGRHPSCELVVFDVRVSKRHAQLRWSGAGWVLDDLASKNGTFVNGEPAGPAALLDGDILSFGGLRATFERLTAAQAATFEVERLALMEASARIRRQVSDESEPAELLMCFLEATMGLTRTERGFILLLSPEGKLLAEVAAGLSTEEVLDDRFSGSLGAVRQVLVSERSVVLSDVRTDPILGKRPSVVTLGLASLACVPIRHERHILGVIYVDSRKLGPSFSELELETLETMAEHVGAILATSRAAAKTNGSSHTAEGELVAQLQRRIEQLLPLL